MDGSADARVVRAGEPDRVRTGYQRRLAGAGGVGGDCGSRTATTVGRDASVGAVARVAWSGLRAGRGAARSGSFGRSSLRDVDVEPARTDGCVRPRVGGPLRLRPGGPRGQPVGGAARRVRRTRRSTPS